MSETKRIQHQIEAVASDPKRVSMINQALLRTTPFTPLRQFDLNKVTYNAPRYVLGTQGKSFYGEHMYRGTLRLYDADFSRVLEHMLAQTGWENLPVDMDDLHVFLLGPKLYIDAFLKLNHLRDSLYVPFPNGKQIRVVMPPRPLRSYDRFAMFLFAVSRQMQPNGIVKTNIHRKWVSKVLFTAPTKYPEIYTSGSSTAYKSSMSTTLLNLFKKVD